MSGRISTDDLVPTDRLCRWLDEQGCETGAAVRDLVRLSGGSQNALFRFRRGERGLVLRRPRGDARPNAGAALAREARLLRAMADTDVPHPRLVAACDDDSVLGAAFYVEDRVAEAAPKQRRRLTRIRGRRCSCWC